MAKKAKTAKTAGKKRVVTQSTARPRRRRKTKWTVMIFMGAATIDGSQPLGDAVEADLDEIRAIGGGGDHDLNVFVEVHGQGRPRRYHFGKGASKAAGEKGELVLGKSEYHDGYALARFIEESLATAKHHRKDHAALVLWGHAYDFAFGRSFTPGGAVAALDFVSIADVLKGLQAKVQEQFVKLDPSVRTMKKAPTLDLIGFDSCDIATVELAYQLRPYAKFMVGSQIGVPIPGWPYHRILDRLKNPKGTLMAPPEFGSYVVRRFIAAYDPSSPVTLTLLNLEHAQRLFDAASAVAAELAMAIENLTARERILEWFLQSQTEPGKPFVDVAELCFNLRAEQDYPGLAQRARVLGDLVAGPVGNVVGGLSDLGTGWPLVAEHGRNSGELVRLNGLSMYAPHVAPPADPEVIRNRYGAFEFAQKTRWSDSVHKLAGMI